MDLCIPDLSDDDELLERLNYVWSAETLHDLCTLISDPTGEPLGLTFREESCDPSSQAVFRYSLWHPHSASFDEDPMIYWTRLGMALVQDTQVNVNKFRDLIKVYLAFSHGEMTHLSPTEKFANVMSIMVLKPSFAEGWLKMAEEFQEGGMLLPYNIDQWTPLSKIRHYDTW